MHRTPSNGACHDPQRPRLLPAQGTRDMVGAPHQRGCHSAAWLSSITRRCPQQDVDILVMVGAAPEPEKIKQQRERLREKKEEHAPWCCTDDAERRDCQQRRPMCGMLKWLWRGSNVFFAPYGRQTVILNVTVHATLGVFPTRPRSGAVW